MYTSTNQEIDPEGQQLLEAVLGISNAVLGFVVGTISGLGILIATIWLVVKGPVGNHDVGPHLALLANFFPGYRVTYWGSIIGFIYGFIAGFVSGWVIGWLYNRIVFLRAGKATRSIR
jgi:hypothetical protein